MAKERDRITFDLKDLRQRLESVSTEPGQSLSSVLRWVAMIGLDLLDACRSLQLPPPRLGETEKWLVEISRSIKLQSEHKKVDVTAITFLKLLTTNQRPTDTEVVQAARESGISEETLLELRDRLFSDAHLNQK